MPLPEIPTLVAFACSTEWVEASAAPEGDKPALPRFAMVAYTGGPMQLAGWRHPVVVDLAGLQIPSPRRPIRLGHDAALGVGHTESVTVEDGTLVARGVVSRDTAAAREVVVSSKNGFPWQASIGASVIEHEFVCEGASVIVNGREVHGPVNVVRRAVLGEISFVDLGADGATSAAITAIQPFAGVPMPDTAPAASQPATASTAPAVQAAADPATSVEASATIDQLRAQAAAETERIVAVRDLAQDHPEIAAKAIREGWTKEKTELEVLRASRPQAPAAHTRPNQDLSGAVLEAACLLAAKHPEAEKAYDDQTLSAASKRYRGGIGLQELILEAAWANGYTGRNFRDSREVLRAAFAAPYNAAAPATAGWSTIDLGGILSNVANKFLLEGFFSVESTWRQIAAVSPVSDFKAITRYRLIGKDTYEKVAPGGELKHGTLGEEKFTNKAETYGLMLSIDRRDLINDDLGAITTVPRKLGRGSGLKLNDVFWSTFLDHAAFFTAANQNLLVGADTALTIDGLTKAEVAFLEQVDPDGKPLGVMPSLLLVPPGLSAYGSQLFKSMELRETTANAKYPVANPHQGKFGVAVSRYLSNPAFAGASQKAWYLLANPVDLAAIEVVFLNGQEAPTIETADADFSVLGIQMRGYHDFGCALQEARAAVKAKGEA
jgi:hypothetical protein